MRIIINSKQLNQINTDLGLNLKSGDYISYNKFITYGISLPDILSNRVYYNILNYFDKNKVKSDIYFDVTDWKELE